MNREIKFRAWFPSEGKMYRWDDFKSYRLEKAFLLEDEGDPKIAMQYTGLKDKNGKEIYEGDIVEYTNDRNCHNYIGKIVYKDCEFCIEVIKSTSFKATSHLMLISDKGFTNNEIIGNVHENPEML